MPNAKLGAKVDRILLEGDRVSGVRLTDGEVIAATAAGDTLCYRLGDDSVVVASEPGDDEPGWAEVPARSVLVATPAGVDVRPLPPEHHAMRDPDGERTATS